MNRLYSKLEFDLVLEQVSKYAANNKVASLIKNTQHLIDYDLVMEALKNTDELMKLLIAYPDLSFRGFKDLDLILDDLNNNDHLDGPQLNEIVFHQEVIEKVIDYAQRIEKIDTYPYFKNEVGLLTDLSDITNQIKHMIDVNGLVFEDATPNLVRINKQIIKNNQQINDYLQQYIKAQANHLSEKVVTYRNNRAVLLVKSASKNIIKGIVHDESSSKQTSFIEPSGIIQLNNDLQSLEYQRNAEVVVVLKLLSSSLVKEIESIKSNIAILSKLNILYAKASYGLDTGGIIPYINKDSAKLEIYQGAHPLIDPKVVVKNDFFICNDDSKYRIVLISGSNTGGKTVSLKMVGLFSLMVQSGLSISALPKTNMPIYTNIFVDIGDEQSIENSLSTFSSHLLNVSKIANEVTKHSLVLLDELGSGTDPSQGENLALAIIEYLYQQDASIVLTTHYNKLKNYALSTSYVKSASVLFDQNSNKPQYQLSFDTYANSNAFAISKMLGLKDEIVDKAIQLYQDSLSTSDELLLKLQDEQLILHQKQLSYDEMINEYENKLKLINDEKAKLELKYDKVLKEGQNKANEYVKEAKNKADHIIKELKKQKAFVNHQVNDLTKQFDDMYYHEEVVEESDHIFKVNDNVLLVKLQRQGTISKVLPKNRYEISLGNIKTNVKKSEIIYVKDKVIIKKKSQRKVLSTKRVNGEINLVGQRVDDALYMLSKYLDDALLSNLDQVRIIHGFGTGALRNAVHEYLKKHKAIDKYYFASYNEGGQGATIALLK